MSKLPRPSTSRKCVLPSASRQSTSRPSTSRPSVSRPSTTSRQSISRPSVYAGRPSTVGVMAKVDAKANMKKNVKDILEFLIEKDYPSVLTRKNLMNPTEMTFKEVFRFIIKDWYPDFECTRLSNDVMTLMYDFGYPYQLKESYFKPVGSPLSWPFLVEALTFLCNIIRLMDYEAANVSQLYTINCNDEDEAEEELKHQMISAKYYREFQTIENGDNEMFKQKYLQEYDIDGTVERLSAENNGLLSELSALREENEKFPEIQAEFKAQIDKIDDEVLELEQDKNEFSREIKAKQEDTNQLQVQFEEKTAQLDALNDETRNQNNEIKRLEEVIADQPPQHEVQQIKRRYHDLIDKKNNLEAENKALVDENGSREISISKLQRELKERMRKLIGEIQTVIPDVKYDTDRVIDNKSIMQLTAIIEKLKKKISDDKQESIRLESKLFDKKIEIQRLHDDLRLESDSWIQARHQLQQKQELSQRERERCISKSNSLTKQLEETRKSIEELRKELRESESHDSIEDNIEEGKRRLSRHKEELEIYGAIRRHREHELTFLVEDMENHFNFINKFIQLKDNTREH